MNTRTRVIVGSLMILAGLFIAIFYSNINPTYEEKEIPEDITRRIYERAGGKKNVTDVQIRDQKKIGKNYVFLYSYNYKNSGESNGYIIYKQYKQKYKINITGQLTFTFKDNMHHNKGLQFIMTDGYLIICGIVNNEDPDTYMITSGNTTIQDQFERNKYFIKEYVLGNPNEFKIEPFK